MFCLHRSFRSSLLALFSGARVIGFCEGALSVFFAERHSRSGALYEAEKNALLLQNYVEAKSISVYPKLNFTYEEVAEAETLLAGRKNFLAIAPGSVWATKRWPEDKFADLIQKCRSLGQVILVGGQDAVDIAVAGKIKKILGNEILDLTGKTSLRVLAAIFSKTTLVIANDSAPLHIAIAVGTSVVGIFGPTTKELGFFPLAAPGKAEVAEVENLDCRPCGLHGHRLCPQGHFRCMRDLDSELVWNKVKNLYASHS